MGSMFELVLHHSFASFCIIYYYYYYYYYIII